MLLLSMIHVPALPGTPKNRLSVQEILRQVRQEAALYRDGGVDRIIVENMHDVPYLPREVGPEVVALMTRCLEVVKEESGLQVGVQILAGANKAALAAALAAECDFIRAEGFVFGHVADEGWMNADSGELLRYRKQIGAEGIQIVTDIKKKHSAHAATSDVDLVETARAAEFFLSDGVIVTGTATGHAASPEEVQAVKAAVQIPVWVGSGVTPENVAEFSIADAVVVGSYLKVDGNWKNAPDPQRIAAMVAAVRNLE